MNSPLALLCSAQPIEHSLFFSSPECSFAFPSSECHEDEPLDPLAELKMGRNSFGGTGMEGSGWKLLYLRFLEVSTTNFLQINQIFFKLTKKTQRQIPAGRSQEVFLAGMGGWGAVTPTQLQPNSHRQHSFSCFPRKSISSGRKLE